MKKNLFNISKNISFFSNFISSIFYRKRLIMKKILYGGVLAFLLNYCIGSTYLLYKVSDKK